MRTDRRKPFVFPDKAPKTDLRRCDHPACAGEGEYRAPRSRDDLTSYYWFCLDHVRAYNASWDYYAGMSTTEIEDQIRNDIGWQRPTWRLGSIGGRPGGFEYRVRDDFGFFHGAEAPAPRHEVTEEEKALTLFGLTPPVSMAEIKARYKKLVKEHHPDSHGGDKAAEERLREIILAYTLLARSYGS